MRNTIFATCAAALLAACAAPDPLAIKTLAKAEQIGIRALVAQNKGQRACTQYDGADNSCASFITSRIVANRLISSELAAVRNPLGEGVIQVEVVSRSTIEGDQACVQAKDISLGQGSTDPDTAAFLLEFTREVVASYGGVCGTYYTSGAGYVVASRGRNGEVFPPGDVGFRFIDGPLRLRAQ